jgi:two-component system alkaline phosphatase synthesis response regulator PhoP
MAQPLVLVVDDEPDIRELVRYNLAQSGFQVLCAETGEEGLRVARKEIPAVMVLDVMLPGIEGLDICTLLKNEKSTKSIRILILSARNEEENVVKGFESGADDYLPKPFSPRVLIARVQNLLRREVTASTETVTDTVNYRELVLDPLRFEVRVGKKLLDITSTEFRILQLFLENPGVVFSRGQIVLKVHGAQYPVTDRSIDVQILNLRRKLGKLGGALETVRGIGYRLKEL